MTARDWRIFKEDFRITTQGGGIPTPIRKWNESVLPDWLMSAVVESGYKKPTPIQMQAIPIGINRRDVLGIAETGSGKTAAFVIPMLCCISNLPKMTEETKQDGPFAIILAPTRELVQQIESETRRFAKAGNMKVEAIFGGVNIEEQGFRLHKGCEIVVASPGRLLDCIKRRYIVLNQCNYVILDEADKMVEKFEEELVQVLEALPKHNLKEEDESLAEQQEQSTSKVYRTTIMFSATMPPEVERLSRRYLRRAAHIYVGEVGKAVDKIEQVVEFVKESDKRRRLEDVLSNGKPPIIIFTNTKRSCDSIAKYLNAAGWRAASMHGGKVQEQRDRNLDDFIRGSVDILVATDLAGRGLDVTGITHVIQYDMAHTIQDYVHRIGRTARVTMDGSQAEGKATTFVTNEDAETFYDLKQMLEKTGQPVPLELAKHPSAAIKPGTVIQSRRETVIYTN